MTGICAYCGKSGEVWEIPTGKGKLFACFEHLPGFWKKIELEQRERDENARKEWKYSAYAWKEESSDGK